MTPYYSEPRIDLYLGDNREVLAALGVKPADVALLWGDPPYGTGLNAFYRSNLGHRTQWSANAVPGDEASFDPAPWLGYPRMVLWGAQYFASRLPDVSCWWTWDKRDGVTSDNQGDCEHAWTNLGGPPRLLSKLWRGGARGVETGLHVHPTQKPEALATWGFQRAGLKPGDLVLSPWLGSGPEAAAAKRLGLRFIGIELVPEYLGACVARLRQGVLPLLAAPSPPERPAGDEASEESERQQLGLPHLTPTTKP